MHDDSPLQRFSHRFASVSIWSSLFADRAACSAVQAFAHQRLNVGEQPVPGAEAEATLCLAIHGVAIAQFSRWRDADSKDGEDLAIAVEIPWTVLNAAGPHHRFAV
ncbi:MAG TPA: hypothetical protein VJ850_08225 [Candidatus Limnocylindrales bacterium]|nr:hypothetical protein [Candidatus Limnocylindrales bacterium]